MEHIQKYIHLTYGNNSSLLKHNFFIERLKVLHHSWHIHLWDDKAAREIVVKYFSDWVDIYDAYPIPVQRSDIFRVMIVYIQGGFYLDLDMLCYKSLDDLCNRELVLGIEKVLSAEDAKRLNHRHPVRIANYMFGSKAGHNFWLDFLNEARKKSSEAIVGEDGVLETTGPGLLTNVFHLMKYKYNNITLLENKEKPCPRSCGPASCHYGNYAAHYHTGSWRWQSEIVKDAP